jgi:excisionase family DNA binding protein
MRIAITKRICRFRPEVESLPDWITTQEAANLSGFHPEYVRRLARQGKIGAEKKGRSRGMRTRT